MEQQEKIQEIKKILEDKEINFNEKTEILGGFFTEEDIPAHFRLDKQHQYTGLNPFALEVSKFENDFTTNLWATLNQATKLGYRVKKGSKGTKISVAMINDAKDEAGEVKKDKNGNAIKKIRFKMATVFNLDQMEELKKGDEASEENTITVEEVNNTAKTYKFDSKYKVVA